MTDDQARTGRRERGVAVLLALAGAVGCLLSGSRTWVHGTARDDLLGTLAVQASGRAAAPLVTACAVVALAAALAVLVGRRLGRAVAGLVLVLAGAAAAAAAVSASGDPVQALAPLVARQTARTRAADVTDLTATVTGWPWVAVVGGVLVALGGVVVVVRARRWAGPSARFEPPPAAPVAGAADVHASGAAGDGGTHAVEAPADDPGAAWDALSRGDDPTRTTVRAADGGPAGRLSPDDEHDADAPERGAP